MYTDFTCSRITDTKEQALELSQINAAKNLEADLGVSVYPDEEFQPYASMTYSHEKIDSAFKKYFETRAIIYEVSLVQL